MIVVRDVFHLKFGKAREAVALWKQGQAISQRAGYGQGSTRLLTDLVGPYYTLVLESTFDSLADYEQESKKLMADDAWHAWYQRFLPLAEGGHREIFNIM